MGKATDWKLGWCRGIGAVVSISGDFLVNYAVT